MIEQVIILIVGWASMGVVSIFVAGIYDKEFKWEHPIQTILMGAALGPIMLSFLLVIIIAGTIRENNQIESDDIEDEQW